MYYFILYFVYTIIFQDFTTPYVTTATTDPGNPPTTVPQTPIALVHSCVGYVILDQVRFSLFIPNLILVEQFSNLKL